MAFPSDLILYISSIEVFSLAVALVLVFLAYRGYKRTRSRSLLLAAAGFGVLGVASLIEGVLYQFVGFSLDMAHLFRSTLTAIGLVVLLYSIIKTEAPRAATGSGRRDDTEPAARVAMPPAGEAGRLDP